MEKTITLAHGSGGRLTAELVEQVFVGTFDDPAGRELEDAAVLDAPAGRVALTTDAFVVKPRFFPGGDIGELSVFGTVNDLAMSGARPLALTAAFVIEEGVEVAELRSIAGSMAAAASEAGVRLVAGDTKVVERGSGDGVYIATAGYGIVPLGISLGLKHIQPGDVILVSGDVGRHEAAILLARGELPLEADVESDCASLAATAAAVLEAGGDGVRCLRDCTRGGLATVLCEYAQARGLDFEIEQEAIAVIPPVAMICELLGLDPLYLANEGRMVAVVDPAVAEPVARALQNASRRRNKSKSGSAPAETAVGAGAVGRVAAGRDGRVLLNTVVGGRRVLDRLTGGQLPRIC